MSFKSNILIAAIASVSILAPTAAFADGSHGTKIEFENTGDKTVKVYTYNGGDDVKSSYHKKYKVKPGATKTVKCHGNGYDACTVEIKDRVDKESKYVGDKGYCEWDGARLECY